MNLLVFDYDGTLNPNTNSMDGYLRSKLGKLLKPELKNLQVNIDAIKNLKNYDLLMSTGRCFDDIYCEIKSYKIPYNYLSVNDGLILMNNHNEIIDRVHISQQFISELYHYQYQYQYHLKLYKIADFTYAIMIKHHYKKRDELINLFTNMLVDYPSLSIKTKQDESLIAIRGGKSRTILLLTKYHQYERIVTVGNDYNDIDMINDYEGYIIENSFLDDDSYNKVESVANLVLKLGSIK